jgi:hypothetical protein
VIAGLQSDALHLVGDPIRGGLAGGGSRTAALKRIVGDRLIARRKIGRTNRGLRRRMGWILRD